ncbi:hypothetical protein QBC47DRAFT_373262 [Echria macrotheca]|uniref:Coiled-coil domain-containing protein 16 n=1 Tax=Echria macrotheca TaxID=438768 RepID=A0AAJ0BL07_9PEZI|nr:hypothetical protein QBC47DRAFT_373262 [Echria macrotheca]
MADVRALLRQQRAARRIEHPNAAYSEAGKLLCVLCHEHIKTESLWDQHVRSMGHRQRVQAQQVSSASANGDEAGNRTGGGGQSHKRKIDEDEDMADATAEEELVRKKRSKPDMTLSDTTARDDSKQHPTNGGPNKPQTPPFTRRQSSTPTIGVEMQIPSRPATPVAIRETASNPSSATGTSSVTTPKSAPLGRSPLIPQDATDAQLPPRLIQAAPEQPSNATISTEGDTQIDDVWAAFEADLVHGASEKAAKPPAVAGFASEAVISAPAMTAAEIAAAAKSEEEERSKRRALVDIQIEDEREDATRALETEFEVMEELEARARKLRERREALRIQRGEEATSSSGAVAVGNPDKGVALGKENAAVEENDEDDEDDEGEDDWVGFRFRA